MLGFSSTHKTSAFSGGLLLRMPDLDGMDVLKAIKQRWPDSEVVVITGYPSLETAKEAATVFLFEAHWRNEL